MPTLKISRNGASGGFPATGEAKPGKRGRVRGWSPGAARRLINWLWSVNASELSGHGFALTLTMGGAPETSDDWHAVRKVFMKRLSRLGFDRQQWLIEWTALGRPHLHMAVYSPELLLNSPGRIVSEWLNLVDAREWPAEVRGQHIVPITGAVGWLEYLSKHASRGVSHYQRQGMPPGWESTGRLWGKWGDWPTEEPSVFYVDQPHFFRYRRLVLDYERHRLKRAGAFRAAKYIGTRYGDRSTGRVSGVSSWIPEDVAYSLLMIDADSASGRAQ